MFPKTLLKFRGKIYKLADMDSFVVVHVGEVSRFLFLRYYTAAALKTDGVAAPISNLIRHDARVTRHIKTHGSHSDTSFILKLTDRETNYIQVRELKAMKNRTEKMQNR